MSLQPPESGVVSQSFGSSFMTLTFLRRPDLLLSETSPDLGSSEVNRSWREDSAPNPRLFLSLPLDHPTHAAAPGLALDLLLAKSCQCFSTPAQPQPQPHLPGQQEDLPWHRGTGVESGEKPRCPAHWEDRRESGPCAQRGSGGEGFLPMWFLAAESSVQTYDTWKSAGPAPTAGDVCICSLVCTCLCARKTVFLGLGSEAPATRFSSLLQSSPLRNFLKVLGAPLIQRR